MIINPYIFKREPNTFIGGIAKLGGTGADAPILTAAELATTLGVSESIIKGFKVVGEDVECRITSEYVIKTAAFGQRLEKNGNENITYFYDDGGLVVGINEAAFNNCTNFSDFRFSNPNLYLAESCFSRTAISNVDLSFLQDINPFSNHNCFQYCTNLVSVDLGDFTMNRVTNSAQFRGCISLEEVSIKIKNYGEIFRGAWAENTEFYNEYCERLNYYSFGDNCKINKIELPNCNFVGSDVFYRGNTSQSFTKIILLPKVESIGILGVGGNNFTRNVNLELLDLRSCKKIYQTNFLNAFVTDGTGVLRIHIDILTSEDGEINPEIDYLYNRNVTIELYDDNGNFVETYNPNPPNEIDWTVHQLGTLINFQSIKTDKNNVWVAAGDGYQGSSTRLITSIDNGMTWNLLNTVNRVWASIDTDENGVWVVVSSGGSDGINSVLMSIDNGATWNQISGITNGYNCIATDKSGNWIGAGGKRILTSNDNGDSWFEYELSEDVNIYSISTDEKGTWIAVSISGDNRILKSTDNGQTWDFISSPENNSWRSISNDKEGTWIAVSNSGDNRILKSTDNGVNWVVQNSIENNPWWSISTDEKGTWVCLAALGDNRLLISRDNGLTWSIEATPENNSWRSISTDTNGLWIGVSSNGTNRILKGVEVY